MLRLQTAVHALQRLYVLEGGDTLFSPTPTGAPGLNLTLQGMLQSITLELAQNVILQLATSSITHAC